jgi:SARP family transcriptional regulator, regulator of embCAB operon
MMAVRAAIQVRLATPTAKASSIRALEAYAAASLGVGGTELAAAERTAVELIERAPFRESGYRLLMEVKAARGNVAEGLQAYEDLRRTLREELGIAPGPASQQVHLRLLQLADDQAGRA